MTDNTPKSALELAMERLRQKDKASNAPDRPLSDEQKAAIETLSRSVNGNPRERLMRDAKAAMGGAV